jgi:DNA-damage-inducible protein D
MPLEISVFLTVSIQTRKAELIEQHILENERVIARRKLTQTEKELSNVIFEQTGGDKNFGKQSIANCSN